MVCVYKAESQILLGHYTVKIYKDIICMTDWA